MDEAERFFADQFFPTISGLGIREIWHLGDLVDRRKYVAFVTSNRMNRIFVDMLRENSCTLRIIPGNHDLPFKNKTSISAERELLPDYPWIAVHDEPTVKLLGERSVMFLPWICDENREKCMHYVEKVAAQVVVAHLELSGFEMYRGKPSDHGMSPKLFERFGLVLSGHYHHKSNKGPIHYLGAPYEMTWSDHDDPRGFHVLDLETMELTFYENKRRPHAKLHYDDSAPVMIHPTTYSGKIVKVIVKEKRDPLQFDQLIASLERAGVESIRVVDDHRHMDLTPDDEVAPLTDPREVLGQCVASLDATEEKRSDVLALMMDLYQRAMEAEA